MASLEKLNLKKKTKKSFRLNLDLCLMLFYAPGPVFAKRILNRIFCGLAQTDGKLI